MSRRSGMDFVIGVAVGTIIGAAAGILLAPNSGKETRKIVTEKTKVAIDTTKDAASKVKGKIVSKVDKLRESIEDAFDQSYIEDDVYEELPEIEE